MRTAVTRTSPAAALHPQRPQHPPQRPGWACSDCGAPYPCRVRCARLVLEYLDAPTSLLTALGHELAEAAYDLGDQVGAGQLYHRIVGWVYDQHPNLSSLGSSRALPRALPPGPAPPAARAAAAAPLEGGDGLSGSTGRPPRLHPAELARLPLVDDDLVVRALRESRQDAQLVQNAVVAEEGDRDRRARYVLHIDLHKDVPDLPAALDLAYTAAQTFSPHPQVLTVTTAVSREGVGWDDVRHKVFCTRHLGPGRYCLLRYGHPPGDCSSEPAEVPQ